MEPFLNWKSVLALFYIALFLLTFSTNKTVRYYACFTLYVVVVSSLSPFFVLIFLLKPFSVTNLRLAASVIKHLNLFLGIDWELRNGNILKESKGAVIVANHQTMLDVMGMWKFWDILDLCTVIAKKEIFFASPFGPLVWLGGVIYINREDPKKAYKEINKKRNILNKGIKIWWFPEGTRTLKPDKFQPFKKGAFRTAIQCKVPIIPVVYSPYYFIDSKKKTYGKGKVIMSTLEPIKVDDYSLEDMDKLMELTYQVMDEEYQSLRQEAEALSKITDAGS